MFVDRVLTRLDHLDLTGGVQNLHDVQSAGGGYAVAFVGECPFYGMSVAVKRIRPFVKGNLEFAQVLFSSSSFIVILMRRIMR